MRFLSNDYFVEDQKSKKNIFYHGAWDYPLKNSLSAIRLINYEFIIIINGGVKRSQSGHWLCTHSDKFFVLKTIEKFKGYSRNGVMSGVTSDIFLSFENVQREFSNEKESHYIDFDFAYSFLLFNIFQIKKQSLFN